jgi:hypothetical protein
LFGNVLGIQVRLAGRRGQRAEREKSGKRAEWEGRKGEEIGEKVLACV